jgi:carbonic anhydrase/acetyltransferase-like protein (isoleucine patch superfamily)
VELGKNCLIASQVGIAGATKLGDGVTLWGQVGLSKTLKLGNNVTVLAQSGLGEDIKDNKIYFGTPAGPALEKQKELVWIKRIPEIWEKVKHLPGKREKSRNKYFYSYRVCQIARFPLGCIFNPAQDASLLGLEVVRKILP